jgi:hypothetical protein
MYGMINQAIKDLVLTKFGEDAWGKICDNANLTKGDFVFMQYYPDKVTYDLVGAASKHLSISGDIILREFGKHWILYTAKEGYGAMMDLFGQDFKSCLQNLNSLHERMGMSMPQLRPPRFSFSQESEAIYIISYFSKRPGLCPMVIGLLEGLAAKYETKATIDFFENYNGNEGKFFKISLLNN